MQSFKLHQFHNGICCAQNIDTQIVTPKLLLLKKQKQNPNPIMIKTHSETSIHNYNRNSD